MATHDYIIDNSTGQNVRQDINNALAAIVSNNSNSSSPSTTYAYQWWADTSNNVLKIRNSANNAWIELLQLDGTLTLEDRSASTPALAFRADLDTGIFSSAANTFDIATAGSKRLIVDSVGRVGIGNITPVSYNAFANTLVVATSTNTGLTLSGNDASANYSGIQFSAGTTVRAYVDQQLNSTGRMRVFNMANGFLEFGTNNEIRMHIKATGEVGIGTTSPSANLESEGNVSSTTQFSGFQGLRIQNANGAAFGVTADINFVAGTGGNNRGAAIGVQFSGATNGNNLYFATNPNNIGSNDTLEERMIITYDGNVNIGRSDTMNTGANNVTGINLQGTGQIIASKNGAAALHIIRQSDTGEVALFGNQGTAIVGSINVTTTSAVLQSGASDRTLKKNFEDWTEDVLSLFKNLKPQKFNFIIEDDGAEKTKGYIAQDLVDSFPEAYPKISEDKYKFAPQGMAVYLMKAIQELEAKVAALESA